MSDNKLEALGKYFVHHDIRNRFEITFEQFIKITERGDWDVIVS